MRQYLQELLKELGGLAILSAAVAWLIRSVLTQYLNKDIEKYKSQLSFENAKQIESLKTQLQISAKEHDIRFNKLHEIRAGILSELFILLANLKTPLSQLSFPLQHLIRTPEIDRQPIVGHAESLHQASKVASDYFAKHQLYFPQDLSYQIETLIGDIEALSSWFLKLLKEASKEELVKSLPDISDRLREASQDLIILKSRMRKEFRSMLGLAKEPSDTEDE
jgi:hypothetical protein